MEILQEEKLNKLKQGSINEYFIGSKYGEKITKQLLGSLYLPTGKIVANDPICFYDLEPFVKCVPIGDYPVYIYVHHIADDCRVSFAEIRFTENIPTTFELAVIEGQDINSLAEDDFFGYGVDSGTGGFMDKSTCDLYEEITKNFDDGMLPEVDKILEDSYVHTYSTANFKLPNIKNNIVFFSSGFGDGVYPSYFGYDKNKELCCLITDFMTIDDSDYTLN